MTIPHTTITLANFWTYEIYICTQVRQNLKLRTPSHEIYIVWDFCWGQKNKPKNVGNT